MTVVWKKLYSFFTVAFYIFSDLIPIESRKWKMENFLIFSSLWNLKFLCTLHGNNKIFLLRFYCIWNSGNWKFASLHKLVFYTLLLHVKLKNQIACVSFLVLLSFSFRFTDNLFFSFIPHFGTLLLTWFLFYESCHARTAVLKINYLLYFQYFYSPNFFYKRVACIKENVDEIFRKKPSPYL